MTELKLEGHIRRIIMCIEENEVLVAKKDITVYKVLREKEDYYVY